MDEINIIDNSDKRPIGLFDSGVGGLTVLKELLRVLPDENYLYFGDTARVPYGEKTKDELVSFSREIIDWYKSKNVKMVLMACNTSSAVTLNVVENEYDFPVLGLIKPTAEYISTLNVKKIGLMATTATVNSKSYSKAVEDFGIEVIDIACPGLVEIVESGNINTQEAKDTVSKYLNPLLEQGVEKIILGCTHYPFLRDIMVELGCDDSMFIDPAKCIVKKAQETLESEGILNKENGSVEYFVSSSPESFEKTSALFLNSSQKPVLISLDKQGFC